MKTLLLLAAIAFVSCSKHSDVTPNNKTAVTVNAYVVDKHWNIILSTNSAIVSKGTATVEWDVYSNGTFGYTRSATITYTFDGTSNVSAAVETNVQGATSMSARNGHVISMSGTGGYSFK